MGGRKPVCESRQGTFAGGRFDAGQSGNFRKEVFSSLCTSFFFMNEVRNLSLPVVRARFPKGEAGFVLWIASRPERPRG